MYMYVPSKVVITYVQVIFTCLHRHRWYLFQDTVILTELLSVCVHNLNYPSRKATYEQNYKIFLQRFLLT